MAPKRTLIVHAGDRFHRLVVVDEARMPGGGRGAVVNCDCGSVVTVAVKHLVGGHTMSCGCARVDAVVARNRRRPPGRTHGLTEHPHYDRWCSINTRCHNPRSKDWEHYGGRGIVVYPSWRESPRQFVAYLENELGLCPPGWSLDRIDNDRGYEPGNLRWADDSTQNLNRRSNGSERRYARAH